MEGRVSSVGCNELQSTCIIIIALMMYWSVLLVAYILIEGDFLSETLCNYF